MDAQKKCVPRMVDVFAGKASRVPLATNALQAILTILSATLAVATDLAPCRQTAILQGGADVSRASAVRAAMSANGATQASHSAENVSATMPVQSHVIRARDAVVVSPTSLVLIAISARLVHTGLIAGEDVSCADVALVHSAQAVIHALVSANVHRV
jgi:hypothetical protein